MKLLPREFIPRHTQSRQSRNYKQVHSEYALNALFRKPETSFKKHLAKTNDANRCFHSSFIKKVS